MMSVVLFKWCLCLLLAAATVVLGHPPRVAEDNNKEVRFAAGNFSSFLTSHLQPFQASSIEMILSAQTQMVSGTNFYLAVVVKDDMTFGDRRMRWPSHEMHWVEMYHPGSWQKDHSWNVKVDKIPHKVMFLDPQNLDGVPIERYANMVVDHINSNCEGSACDEPQVLRQFIRADVQVYGVENWSKTNQTKLDNRDVMLAKIIFVTENVHKYNSDDFLGVGYVSRDFHGREQVVSGWSASSIPRRDPSPDDNGNSNSDRGNKSKKGKGKGGMGGGEVFALVFFLSGFAGGASYLYGNKKGRESRHKVPKLDEFESSAWYREGGRSSSSTEMTGMDMRPMEGIVKADQIDAQATL